MERSQDSVVTAGRFLYLPGTGYHNDENDPSLGWDSTNSTFDFGTYDYSAGGGNGFQPMTYDWRTVFDYGQNAIACTAPSFSNGWNREASGLFGGSCFNKP